MPCIAPYARARVLQRLELQPIGGNANSSAIREETLAIGRYQMRHGAPLPHMSMEPEAAIHGVNHSLSPRPKLPKVYRTDRPRTAMLVSGRHA